jgi:hypothetical protein
VGAICDGRRCATVRFFLVSFFFLDEWPAVEVEEGDCGVSARLNFAMRSEARGRLACLLSSAGSAPADAREIRFARIKRALFAEVRDAALGRCDVEAAPHAGATAKATDAAMGSHFIAVKMIPGFPNALASVGSPTAANRMPLFALS